MLPLKACRRTYVDAFRRNITSLRDCILRSETKGELAPHPLEIEYALHGRMAQRCGNHHVLIGFPMPLSQGPSSGTWILDEAPKRCGRTAMTYLRLVEDSSHLTTAHPRTIGTYATLSRESLPCS